MFDSEHIRQHFLLGCGLCIKGLCYRQDKSLFNAEYQHQTYHRRKNSCRSRKLQALDNCHAVELTVCHTDALQGCQLTAAVCNARGDNVQQIDECRQRNEHIQYHHTCSDGRH